VDAGVVVELLAATLILAVWSPMPVWPALRASSAESVCC